MKARLTVLAVLAAMLMPGLAFAQSSTVTFLVDVFYPDLDYFQGPDVEATVECNAGQPLTQMADAGDEDYNGAILFTVTDVPEDFTTTCTVTFGAFPEGFELYGAQASNDGDGTVNFTAPVCTFTDGDQPADEIDLYDENECRLWLIPAPFDFEVIVDWTLTPDADPNLGEMAGVLLECSNIFDYFGPSYTSTSLSAAPGYTPPLALTSVRPDPDAYYTTNWGDYTWCYAILTGTGSAVEVDNDCWWDGVPVNSTMPMPECTIAATAWYEGIPTLSQYGMAIMALLMLGMGFIGFRRFV